MQPGPAYEGNPEEYERGAAVCSLDIFNCFGKMSEAPPLGFPRLESSAKMAKRSNQQQRPTTGEPGRLTPREQFWWGLFGGCLILGFRAWSYSRSLPFEAPWPSASFRMCVS